MMTTEQFTYWLQGFFEISDVKTLDEKQVQIIKDHLNSVFNKQTPNRNSIEEMSQSNSTGLRPSKRGPTIYC
jgi:hypothetical protein